MSRWEGRCSVLRLLLLLLLLLFLHLLVREDLLHLRVRAARGEAMKDLLVRHVAEALTAQPQ